MNEWNDFSKIKPKLGDYVLIFRQGYGLHKNYYSDYCVAVYIKNPYDKRRYSFVSPSEKNSNTPWIYTKVTHWMSLPAPPEKIRLADVPKSTAASMVQELFGSK